MSMVNHAEMSIRLDRLEEQNRLLRRYVHILTACFVSGLALVLILVLSWPRLVTIPRSIRAQQFVLEDETGHVHAILGIKPGIPKATMVDSALERLGYRRRPLSVSGVFGPTLRFFDENDKQRMVVGSNMVTGGIPLMSMADENGLDRFVLYTMGDGSSVLEMRDSSSNRRLSLNTMKIGQAIIQIADANGQSQFLVPSPPTKNPSQ
jgi:hypothetical protein